MRCHLDYETACDLDLKKVGVRRYVSHHSFRVLLSAWAWGDGPVEQVEGFWFPVEPCNVHAFNAPFERAVAEQVLGPRAVAHVRWRCTMVHAYARGFSGGLADVGEQIGIPKDRAKLMIGSRLIKKFCSPRKPSKSTPDRYLTKETARDDWNLFLIYNRQDVAAEREIWRVLDSLAPWTRAEQELWVLDRKINDRGVPVDVKLAENAVVLAKRYSQALSDQCAFLTKRSGSAREIRPGEVGRLLEWSKDHGYRRQDLKADTIRKFLKLGGTDPLLTEVLQIRLDFAQAATKKFQAILNRAHEGRMHDTLQMRGAQRTGRWAGRGLQLQNLKRPRKGLNADEAAELLVNDPEAFYQRYTLNDLGSLVRSAIVAR